jgi:phospholipase/carboxylesterase
MAKITQMRHASTSLDYLKVHNDSKKLVIILHGYGASQNDLLGLHSVIDPENKHDWVFPNGPLAIDIGNHMEGRAWFAITSSQIQAAAIRGEVLTFSDACPADFLAALEMLKTMVEDFKGEYEEIVIGGFSQGSMITAHVASQVDGLKGLITLSGNLIASSHFSENQKVKSLPFFQSHGVVDSVLAIEKARDFNKFLNDHGFKGELLEFHGGHEIPTNVISGVKSFLDKLS